MMIVRQCVKHGNRFRYMEIDVVTHAPEFIRAQGEGVARGRVDIIAELMERLLCNLTGQAEAFGNAAMPKPCYFLIVQVIVGFQ